MQKTSFLLSLLILIAIGLCCDANRFDEGKRIYSAYCSNCHMDDGSGLAALIPPLTDKQYLIEHQDEIVCYILYGQQGKITVNGIQYDEIMPGSKLSDVQVLNLVNYISNNWGNDLGYTTITEIKERKAKCPD